MRRARVRRGFKLCVQGRPRKLFHSKGETVPGTDECLGVNPDAEKKGSWVITHIPTGQTLVARGFNRKRDAFAAAKSFWSMLGPGERRAFRGSDLSAVRATKPVGALRLAYAKAVVPLKSQWR